MKTIIIGAGLVGSQLARHLIELKGDVVLVERDEETARHAANRLDCLVLHDQGNNLETLEEAGLAKADALVCVTNSDEVNMIICGLASSRYPSLLKIARVRNPDYTKLGALDSPMLGIDFVVHPDVEAAKAILRAVEHGALGDVLSIGETTFELGAIDVGSDASFAGRTVRDFRVLAGQESLVTLIERGETRIIPTGKSVIEPGDRIHVVARERNLGAIFELAGRKMRPLRRIGIVGGSRIGSLVVEGLLDERKNSGGKGSAFLNFLKPRKSHSIVLIEKDYRLCKDLSQKYPGILVLNEDISDEGFIDEENITDLDLLVTATDNQELNMIAAIYLKTRGIGRTISLVNSSGYAAIARRLGVDVVVPLKSVVVDSILSHLIGGGIRSVHSVADGSIEILDMELGPASRAAGRRLGELMLSEGSLVMLVTRDGDAFIPTGDCVFSAGDRVALIVRKGGEAEVERIFGQAV
jgi:trk system potassium uptake protein TrkA